MEVMREATTSGHGRPLRALLEELLDHADGEPAPGVEATHNLGSMEPILCAEHDGTRYVLLRGDAHPAREAVTLSSRELEIARMIARGHTNRTIAAVLEISPWTVSTHLRRMFAKVDVGSRAAMIAKLTSQGVLDEADSPDARRLPRF